MLCHVFDRGFVFYVLQQAGLGMHGGYLTLTHEQMCFKPLLLHVSFQERATRVRACNYVKIKAGRNFPPILKIVTHTGQAVLNVNVAKSACDQCSIFSTVQ